MLVEPSPMATSGGLACPAAGWAGSPALPHRPGEGEGALRAFQLAEQLGSVNAAAAELETSWPTLRKAFGRVETNQRASG